MQIDADQLRVLEILASGAMNAIAILFTVVAVLVGAIATTSSRSEALQLRFPAVAAVIFVLVALVFAVLSILALSYRTSTLYMVVVVFGWVTVAAIALGAIFLLREAIRAS